MSKTKKEDVLKMINSNDDGVKGAAERIIGVCKYPDDYWVMPDYYYPGLVSEIYNKHNFIKGKYRTSNDNVIVGCMYEKEDEDVFRSTAFIKNDKMPNEIIFHDNEIISIGNGETVIELPFELLCGVFLKAREKGYKKPDVLVYAGPKDEPTKEKWLSNQEKIKELQSEVPEEWLK